MKIAAVLVLVLVSLADVGLLLAQRLVNEGRIGANTPPLLEFSALQVLAVYGVLVLAVLILRRFIATRVQGAASGWHRNVAMVAVALLIIRGGVVAYAYQAPEDRARMLATTGRIAAVDAKLQNYYQETEGFPRELAVLQLTEEQLRDGWGFRLDYQLDPDGHGYTVRAIGVPRRLERMAGYSRREIRRRVDARSDGTSLPDAANTVGTAQAI